MPGRDPRTSPNARFLSPDMQDGRARRPIGNALSVSVLTHAAGFLCIALAISRLPAADPPRKTPSEPPSNITWIAQPGRGGGASGNVRLEPPRQAHLPGRDVLTVPVTRPPANAAELPNDPAKLEHVQIPAVTTMAGVQELPGIISPLSPVAITDSQGPGSGGRGGQARGSGDGPGAGPGLGPGRNGGTGGDAYQVGNGVMPPRLIRELRPGYTPEAMRARIQGMVTLQAVVMPDGSVGTAHVVRSLDSTFGLDQEALKTVKLWHFIPGTLAGRAVPVLVEVELTFTLR